MSFPFLWHRTWPNQTKHSCDENYLNWTKPSSENHFDSCFSADSWLVLQPTTRGRWRCFGFTSGKLLLIPKGESSDCFPTWADQTPRLLLQTFLSVRDQLSNVVFSRPSPDISLNPFISTCSRSNPRLQRWDHRSSMRRRRPSTLLHSFHLHTRRRSHKRISFTIQWLRHAPSWREEASPPSSPDVRTVAR